MKRLGKMAVCLLLALMLSAAVFTPALAEISSVREMGNGSVEIRWTDTNAAYILFAPKVTRDMYDDMDNYGFLVTRTGSGRSMIIYYMAPGQSYWVATLDSGYDEISTYSYTAPAQVNFSEFKQHPSISDFALKMKNAAGKKSDLSVFNHSDLENNMGTNEFGVSFRYDYPRLKTARNYLGQMVITSPDGIKYVDYAFNEELPAGNTYATVSFYSLNDYFDYLIRNRESVPVGKYTLAIYWDGQYVFSSNFTVR